MIYDLAQRVKAELRARKFPYPVHYGPERAQRTGFAAGIVFERDRAAGDQIAPPVGAKAPPAASAESPYVRRVAGAVTVFARSSRPGAASHDHEDEVDRVCDGVICAMYRICKGARLPLEFVESRLLEARDFGDCETWPGSAARVRFLITTLVRDVDYKGAGPDTGTVDDVHAPLVTSDFPDFDPVGA